MNRRMQDHYKQLVGRKITGLCEDRNSDIGEVPGFVLDDGTLVWVLRDPEGNGPGFLEIQKPKSVR